jgi:hypothetical protein
MCSLFAVSIIFMNHGPVCPTIDSAIRQENDFVVFFAGCIIYQ